MNLKYLNARYALCNIGFMLLVSGSLGFAYNYLSQSGFESGTIGTVMSIVSLLGVFIGPAAGDIVDRSDKITQKTFITGSMVICVALSAVLLALPKGSFLILPVIIIAFAASTVGMPLLNGMAFIYEKSGGVINYGLCRGLGSAAYAVGSNIVGRLWGVFGRNTLPIWVILGAVLTAVAINLMPNAPKQAAPKKQDKKDAQPEESISVLQFFGKYPKTITAILALVLLYFCHNVFNTYLGAVLGDIMKGSTDEQVAAVQGNALFIQAMVELPTMFGFALILKKLSVNQVMAISAIFYSLKHIVLLLASNIPMFYAGMILQMFSYAALTPAIVYYANEQVSEEDRNKGQAVFMTANTVGGLLASFVGGWIFQLLSVRAGLTVSVIASVAGTILMVLGTGLSGKKGSTVTVRKKR